MGKSGITYFWCGGVAVFLSWALSGCYIGNKEVDAPFNGPWFYETQLSNIQVCAAVNGQATICKNSILADYLPQFYIPLVSPLSMDFSSLTDPVLLSQLDSTTAAALGANYAVSNSDGTGGFVVNANGTPTSPVSYSASSEVEVFHDVSSNPPNNPTCVMDTNVQVTGNLTNTGPFTTYSANPLSGRIVYTIKITMTPDPTMNTGCAQAIRCYNDPINQCEGVGVNEVGAIFQDFTILGALDLSTYPTINSLSYTIQYQ